MVGQLLEPHRLCYNGGTPSTAFAYDNLNRQTQGANWTGSSFGTAYAFIHDIYGNRVTRGDPWEQYSNFATYQWDDLNRLKKTVSETGGASYKYRADGMRTEKVTDVSLSWYYDEINDSSFWDMITSVNKPTTRFFYDGQMAMEEDFAELVPNEDPYFDVTRYGLGARGIDYAEKITIEDETVSFPIYDGHGNNIASLVRTGSSYALSSQKGYDVWGGVRLGSAGAGNRYCANLGHQQDDESGLIYMRARYYEPGSGRFISEDSAMDGLNWFVYCENDPVNSVDSSGKEKENVELFGYLYRFDKDGEFILMDGKRNPLWSAFPNGVFKHDASGVVRKFFKELIRKAGSNKHAARLLARLRAGGYGLKEFLSGFALFAISSLDAYAQQEPADFADTCAIIFSGGRHGLGW